jgi:hypothetical protein
VASDKRSADQEPDDSASPEETVDPVLEAKYLDYCSARLSEVFLSLSDERIYQLVEEAAREGRLDVATLSFDEMVTLVTEKLQRSVPLPDFRTWAREYREDPGRFDAHLMGLWEKRTENGAVESAGDEDPDRDDAPDGGQES